MIDESPVKKKRLCEWVVPKKPLRLLVLFAVAVGITYDAILRLEDPAFSETTAYAPNSPYAASKASADHLVNAYHHTFGMPALITNCSNNYGPYQFPEKLIPLMIVNALSGKPLPVYGDGSNIRDWLYVEDHVRAIEFILESDIDAIASAVSGWTRRSSSPMRGATPRPSTSAVASVSSTGKRRVPSAPTLPDRPR